MTLLQRLRAEKLGALAALFFLLAVPLALFGKIADGVRDGETPGFDEAILQRFHAHASSGLDLFFVWVAKWGGAVGLLPLAVVVLVVLVMLGRRGDAWFWLTSVGGACALNLSAKQFFGRHRPALWLSPAPQSDFGFPSGHAMLSTAVFGALIVLAWRTRWRWPVTLGGALGIALICASRLYLGVHYPTDVIAGICASLSGSTARDCCGTA